MSLNVWIAVCLNLRSTAVSVECRVSVERCAAVIVECRVPVEGVVGVSVGTARTCGRGGVTATGSAESAQWFWIYVLTK